MSTGPRLLPKPFGRGECFDMRTYRGNFLGFLFWCAATYLMWHTHDLYVWWDSLWGVESHINVAKQSWARVWAVIIGGSAMLSTLGSAILIYFYRRDARKLRNQAAAASDTMHREKLIFEAEKIEAQWGK